MLGRGGWFSIFEMPRCHKPIIYLNSMFGGRKREITGAEGKFKSEQKIHKKLACDKRDISNQQGERCVPCVCCYDWLNSKKGMNVFSQSSY